MAGALDCCARTRHPVKPCGEAAQAEVAAAWNLVSSLASPAAEEEEERRPGNRVRNRAGVYVKMVGFWRERQWKGAYA